MKPNRVISFLSACAGGGLGFLFSGQDAVFAIILFLLPFVIPIAISSLRNSFDFSQFDKILKSKIVKIAVALIVILFCLWGGQFAASSIGTWGTKLSIIASSLIGGLFLSSHEKEAEGE